MAYERGGYISFTTKPAADTWVPSVPLNDGLKVVVTQPGVVWLSVKTVPL